MLHLMTMFQNRHRIESTRLADWDYSSRGWYFVTLCTKDKKCYFGHALDGQVMLSDAGIIAETEMNAVSSHYLNVIIDRFVVMPNHLHAIVVIEGDHVYSPDGRIPPRRDAACRVSRQRTRATAEYCGWI
jgi:REP element-mobilizing transposase RayT